MWNQQRRPEETAEEALQRRKKESEKVEQRLVAISTEEEFADELLRAGNKLVVLEVQSQTVCQTGWDEEPELQWEADRKAALEPCRELKHVFLRTARDCPDVVFLTLDADDEEGAGLQEKLGIEVLPTVQFYREGNLLWEHKGYPVMQQNLGEGVLFFGDSAADGVKASTYVTEIHSKADFESFIAQPDDQVLTVVDVSLSNASPCIHIYPAVLALAKNFQGYASFARLLGDESEELGQLMSAYNIVQVPTFLFFRAGKETGRHVGSSRGDLIGQILAQQSALGIAPPTPQGQVAQRRSTPSKAEKRQKKSLW